VAPGDAIDEAWIRAAVAATAPDQLVPSGASAVPDPVHRLRMLLEAWAVGFAARRPDVASATLKLGRRGLHPDECASFLRALDARLVHVDSAGFAWPLAVRHKPKQSPYALCWKVDPGVGVDLEYLIQLGVVAELHADLGWPATQLQVELGEFDAEITDRNGRALVEVEAKARAAGTDSLGRLLLSWLTYSTGPPPVRGQNAANKYLHVLELTEAGPVHVLLAAAGARWWLRATRAGDRLVFTEHVPERWRDQPPEAGRTV
jgi:hypothetical protein